MLSDPSVKEARRALWLAGLLSWKFHANQLVIDHALEDLPPEVKEAILLCCRRFGKSFFGCVKGLERAIRRKRLIRIVGPTIKQTVMIVDYNMAKITDELASLGLRGFVEHVKSEKCYRIPSVGSAIYLGGFDSQEDSLRGGEADDIFVEETGSSRPDDYKYQMKSVLKPQLLKTRGRMVHLTTLPPLPGHPFETETIPQAQLDNAFFSFTIYDDPLATPEIIADAIKDCGGAETTEFKREYLNESVRDSSLVVIPDYDDARHVREVILPNAAKPTTTIDWGGVRDKTVALLHWYDFMTDKLVFWDERSFPANTATDFIIAAVLDMERALPADLPHSARFADVPGQLLVDLNQGRWQFPVATPPKDDWQAGINALAVAFTQDKVIVHPRCKLLRQTLKSGTFNKQRTDFDRTQALGHCDALAAAMYANRVQDRTNPFPKMVGSPDHVFTRKRPKDEEIAVAEAIQPRTFGPGPKRFGTIR